MKIIHPLLFIALLFFQTKLHAQIFPQTSWQHNFHPENNDWDIAKLESLQKFVIDSTQVTGMMIIHKGLVVFEYGDVVENSYIASCRKSILAMLYGKYVKSGAINLHKTLLELDVEDVGGLLPVEKEATIQNILEAKSGVFHMASYPGDFLEFAPERGSVKPGSYWLYSNWDFNVAGYIFEKETGQSIYDEVEEQLAKPLMMQDWKMELQKKEGDTTRSYYPAYPMFFSTRDMARVGLLMLNKGKWMDKQLIDEKWVQEMVKPFTDYTEVDKNIPIFRGKDYSFGYGLYWWLWQNTTDNRFKGGYSALGHWGQSISIFPAIETVIVYKTNDIYQRETSEDARFRLLQLGVQCYNIVK